MIKFGPSGACEKFRESGRKSSEEVAAFVKENGLELFEYSFGRGVNIGEEKAKILNNAFQSNGVEVSVHAPYFINLATPDEEKAINSFNYILNSAVMGRIMGAKRVIFHPASQGKMSREEAVALTAERMKTLAQTIRANGLDDMVFYPETMGKIAQIGSVEEITELCKVDGIYVPVVDFGHENSRTDGSLKTEDDFKAKMQYMIDNLGFERVKNFHVHFSKIQYTKKGEVKHLNFDDNVFGPDFEPFIDACTSLSLEPHVICESAGHQTDDSVMMKKYYLEKL